MKSLSPSSRQKKNNRYIRSGLSVWRSTCVSTKQPLIESAPARPLRWPHICELSKECGYVP